MLEKAPSSGGDRGGSEAMEPILTKYVREPNSYTLDFYLKHEGYEGLKKALGMKPNEVIDW